MGAITDLLKSLAVTPVTPEKKWCNQLQPAPAVAVTPVTRVTPEKATRKTENANRGYYAFRFTLDGRTTITAIRPGGCALNEMRHHLGNQFGVGRITDLRGLQGAEPAYTTYPSLREKS